MIFGEKTQISVCGFAKYLLKVPTRSAVVESLFSEGGVISKSSRRRLYIFGCKFFINLKTRHFDCNCFSF